ncbi:hypothetical protein BH18ACT5_BH18ACT5_15410 [soil metagenome]
MNPDYELGALSSRQAGYLGHGQANARGLSDAAIRWRVTSGLWQVARRGLYKVDGVDGDYHGLLRAAMAILPDPTVSHESAAEALKIPFIATGKAVVTVNARTTHDFPGVKVHRSFDMVERHRQMVSGLWTTTPSRTLIDLAAVVRPKRLSLALDETLASGQVDIEQLQNVLDEVARKGRTGCRLMRELIVQRFGDEMVKATRLEKVGMSLFERGGIPRPMWQFPAPWDPTKRIDFAWPWCCVGCEADGRRWHTRVNDFQTDRDRDNLALTHNWRIFRFTWSDFTERPEFVLNQLRGAIV